MPYKEKEDDKLYYSIGEVAKMLDVNTSLIRFWEKEFDILKPHKNKKGNRLFTLKDLDNIKKIYELVKVKGLTLQGAKKALRIKDSSFLEQDHTEKEKEVSQQLVSTDINEKELLQKLINTQVQLKRALEIVQSQK